MTPWYAIYTRPRHEKSLLAELNSRSIEAFLPTYTIRRRWSDRTRLVEEPLFKGYVFVRIAADQCRQALHPYGAVGLVMFDGRPAEIPADEIENIRRLVTADLPRNPHPYLRVGRPVRVTSGPLQGCEGVLTRKKGTTRLVLSIHMLQQSVVTEVDSECVEPC